MEKSQQLVAIVDDNRSVRTALVRLFRSVGYATVQYGSGGELLAALDKQLPACLILDVHMPEMDGMAVCARVQARWPGLPVIFITGNLSPDVEASLARFAPQACLGKPVDDQQLIDAVQAALRCPWSGRGDSGLQY